MTAAQKKSAPGFSPQLLTKRLALRRIRTVDSALMLAIWNDPAFVEFVGDRGVRTDSEARVALRESMLTPYDDLAYGPCRLALRHNGVPIGLCGLFQRTYLTEPDLGFALLPAYRGQGFAFEAATAILDDAVLRLGLRQVAAIVTPANKRSVALLRRLGFTPEREKRPAGIPRDVLLFRQTEPEKRR